MVLARRRSQKNMRTDMLGNISARIWLLRNCARRIQHQNRSMPPANFLHCCMTPLPAPKVLSSSPHSQDGLCASTLSWQNELDSLLHWCIYSSIQRMSVWPALMNAYKKAGILFPKSTFDAGINVVLSISGSDIAHCRINGSRSGSFRGISDDCRGKQ